MYRSWVFRLRKLCCLGRWLGRNFSGEPWSAEVERGWRLKWGPRGTPILIATKTTTTVVSISHFRARWKTSAFKVRHLSFAAPQLIILAPFPSLTKKLRLISTIRHYSWLIEESSSDSGGMVGRRARLWSRCFGKMPDNCIGKK